MNKPGYPYRACWVLRVDSAAKSLRAFIALRKPDESIKHDSNDQEPKLYERGKEIVHRRALRRCDIKQPTFPEKVCTACACAEPIEEALAVPERHERNRNQRGRMQKNCTGPGRKSTSQNCSQRWKT